MKVKATVGMIYPVREFKNLKGEWRSLDVVLRSEEKVTYKDGGTGVIKEFMAVRIRGEQIEKFQSEVREGSVIEAQVRFNCDEKHALSGNVYLQNDLVFSCPEWKVINY